MARALPAASQARLEKVLKDALEAVGKKERRRRKERHIEAHTHTYQQAGRRSAVSRDMLACANHLFSLHRGALLSAESLQGLFLLPRMLGNREAASRLLLPLPLTSDLGASAS